MLPRTTASAVLFAIAVKLSAQGIITTIAGGPTGFPPAANNGPALQAPLQSLIGIAVDSDGNVFAADSNNNVVVKVSAAGLLTVVAGNGLSAFSGDGGPALEAGIPAPRGIALDSMGNLYIASINRVRKVTPDGKISTIAGNGSCCPPANETGPAVQVYLSAWGVTLDATGNLYIADPSSSVIRRVTPDGMIATIAGSQSGFGGDGGPARNARLAIPWGIAAASDGSLYIADYQNHRIRKIDAAGTITTVAGNGQQGFSGDGGQATAAQLSLPSAVAVDSANNIYIADFGNFCVRRVTPEGIIHTIAGIGRQSGFSGDGGPAIDAHLGRPQGLALDQRGNLLIADGNHLRKLDRNGVIATIAGSGTSFFYGEGIPAIDARFTVADGIAVSPEGVVYVSDSGNHRIRKVTADGIIRTVAGNGIAGYSGDGGDAAAAQLNYPRGLALDAAGALYVADVNNSRIRKITPDGTINTVAGNGQSGFSGDCSRAEIAQLSHPQGVAVDRVGNLYIADTGNYRVRKVTPGGLISTIAGTAETGFSGDGGPAISARLSAPSAIAVDGANNLYIVDSNVCYPAPCSSDFPFSLSNQRVRKIDSAGVITTFAGNGLDGFAGDGGPATSAALCFPEAVAVDPTGIIYIADSGNNVIRKVDQKGIISTVVGSGKNAGGFGGDGGLSSSATIDLSVDDYLKSGGGVAVGPSGDLFIADLFNRRIRKVAGLNLPYVTGLVNAASSAIRSIAARGEIATVFGYNFAADQQVSPSGFLPTALLGLTVSVAGRPAPLFFVSSRQINFQVPFDAPSGPVPVAVKTPTGSADAPLTITDAAPGIFVINGNQGAVVTSTGEIAGPFGGANSLPMRPAKRGESISIYATGLGMVTNAPASGEPAPTQSPFSETILKVSVTIGGESAPSLFSGLAPYFVGLYQVNIKVPETTTLGDRIPLFITAAGVASNTVSIAVE